MALSPKEKAEQLMEKYYESYIDDDFYGDYTIATKKSSLIAVDEIIESRKEDGSFDDTLLSSGSEYYSPHPMYLTYWLEVKKEIENL